MESDKNNIIIKKVKKGGHGHHGGAWKVAYADFVTAMMAFFLLLWLLNAVPTKKLQGIAEYFTPTIGLRGEMGIGFKGGTAPETPGTNAKDEAAPAIVPGSPPEGAVAQIAPSVLSKLDLIDAKNFTNMEHDLYKAIHDNPELKEFRENIMIDQTPEGLRIQLLDQLDKPMFIPGTAILEPYTKVILKVISAYIRYLPNYLSIDGHTSKDKVTVSVVNDPNWILSAQRADTTRMFLTNGLIDPAQVARIVGYADKEPLDAANPESPVNMRISLILLKNSILPYDKQNGLEELNFDSSDNTPPPVPQSNGKTVEEESIKE